MPKALDDQKWYELPDGTPVIACAACERDDGGAPTGGYVLYDQSEWEEAATAGYEPQPDGRITLWGDDTGWTTDDLAAQLGRDAPDEYPTRRERQRGAGAGRAGEAGGLQPRLLPRPPGAHPGAAPGVGPGPP